MLLKDDNGSSKDFSNHGGHASGDWHRNDHDLSEIPQLTIFETIRYRSIQTSSL